jgi:integrative and conjugative element protein (TIGR02256 family)
LFCTQPHVGSETAVRLRISGRITSEDPQSGFETRISESAWAAMQATIDRSAWKHGRRVETGGVILGEKDEVLKIIWVDELTEPPKDSTHTEVEFVCGIAGTSALHNKRDKESRGSIRYIGMWHTHPDSMPLPSLKDMKAMISLSNQTGVSDAHTLMLIVGTPYRRLSLASYVFSRSQISQEGNVRTCSLSFPPSVLRETRKPGIVSGVVFRAIRKLLS